MERRNFFKIVGTASGGLITGACGRPAREIIPILVPEREVVPGMEQWHPGVCRECEAGCGTIARVMEGERVGERDGQKIRQRIAAVKKIEGNPLDSVGGGRLCARGQAAVQALYHPDRVRGARKRSGARGAAAFAPVSWEQALSETAALFENAARKDPSRIVFLTRPQAGSRSFTIASFLKALGAPPASTTGVNDFTIERKAAEIAFGWKGLPAYDIQNADVVLSLGADFLGGWVSPVFYARGFGHMRQGRPGKRGRLVHAESRFSLTAGKADRWLPVRPGGEHALALAIGHVLVVENLAQASGRATAKLRDSFAAVDFDRAAKTCGLQAEVIRGAARELGRSDAPVVLAGASIVQPNSLEAVVAANALNWLLGSVNRKGGVSAPPPAMAAYSEHRPRYRNLLESLEKAELVVLDGVNPVYVFPAAGPLLAKAPAIVSFAPLVDDSTAYADLILPDHATLESAAVEAPAIAPGPALTGARSFVLPLYDTRATEEVLAEVGKKLGHEIDRDAPRNAFRKLFAEQKPGGDWTDADEFASYCERQGGWWSETGHDAPATPPPSAPPLSEAEPAGNPAEYPLQFQPYPSLQFADGSGAHLPWLQELPDPASSAMWSLAVEIDAATARKLGVGNGQRVRLISPAGRLEAPVYVHPAAIPGVASMAIGQGHSHYGRYASDGGANPLAIAVPAVDKQTGVFAFGATRVRMEKAGGSGGLVQFSAVDREPEIRRR